MKKIIALLTAAGLALGGAAVLPEGVELFGNNGIIKAQARDAYTFKKVNGGTVSEYNNGYKCTIVVYGRPNCGNTRSTLGELKALSESLPDLKVIFADIDGNSSDAIKQFRDEMNMPKVDFTYSTDDYNDDCMWSYCGYGSITLPVVTVNNTTGNLAVSIGYRDNSYFLPYLEQCGIDMKAYNDNFFSDISLDVKYSQSDARKMIDDINSFRTGSQAWAWDSSNTKKVQYTGLGKLTYDYELEKVAMQRAAELVALYDHTRPDNTSCFTAYTDTYSQSYMGENIAIGNDIDHDYAFELWREDDYEYDGQGHRRNMLSSGYNSVGIACVEYKGLCYWVQEFSSTVGSAVYTTPADSTKNVNIRIYNDNISEDSLVCGSDSLSVYESESVSLPQINREMMLSDQWYWAPYMTVNANAEWKITSGADTVTISGGKVKGTKAGKARLTATANGESVGVDVTVSHKYTDKIISPTYDEQGYTLHTCSQCGYSYKDNYKAKLIRLENISTATVTGIANKTYTGSAIKLVPTVTFNGKTLTNGTDYTVAYKNNTNVGTATITITGKGNYTGTVSKTFKINAASLAKADVSGIKNKAYTTKAITQSPTVKVGGRALKKGTDFTLTYKNNKAVGTATVTITGKGNYTGSIKKAFKITKASVAKAKVTGISKRYKYTGKAIKPAVKTVKLGNVTLKKGRDYTVSYKNNKKAGTATVIITGKGSYKGTVKKTFKILSAQDYKMWQYTKQVVTLVNKERTKRGLKELKLNEKLYDKAMIRSKEITKYFAHTRPDGTDCFTVVEGINYWTVGENIAAGQRTPQEVVNDWMNSPGHRANILNSSFTDLYTKRIRHTGITGRRYL